MEKNKLPVFYSPFLEFVDDDQMYYASSNTLLKAKNILSKEGKVIEKRSEYFVEFKNFL
jgi:hypothetical protein